MVSPMDKEVIVGRRKSRLVEAYLLPHGSISGSPPLSRSARLAASSSDKGAAAGAGS
jgi:hypothetical protein